MRPWGGPRLGVAAAAPNRRREGLATHPARHPCHPSIRFPPSNEQHLEPTVGQAGGGVGSKLQEGHLRRGRFGVKHGWSGTAWKCTRRNRQQAAAVVAGPPQHDKSLKPAFPRHQQAPTAHARLVHSRYDYCVQPCSH